MDIEDIFLPDFGFELPDRLEKGQTLDITDGAAYFDNDDIDTVGYQFDALFDLIRNVGDHLHRTSQVVSPPLLGNDRVIDFTRRKIVVAAQFGTCKALIVTKVQVGFGTIVRDKNLSVLKGIHGARIDIDVWIQLLNGNRQSPAFKQCAYRRRCKTLAQ